MQLTEDRVEAALASAQSGAAAAPFICPKELRALCERSLRLVVWPEGGREYSVTLADGDPRAFVDPADKRDPYPQEMWDGLAAHFATDGAGLSEARPGSRYACARALAELGLPCVRGLTLGELNHVVALAMGSRRILGWSAAGRAVPYLEVGGRDQGAVCRERPARAPRARRAAAGRCQVGGRPSVLVEAPGPGRAEGQGSAAAQRQAPLPVGVRPRLVRDGARSREAPGPVAGPPPSRHLRAAKAGRRAPCRGGEGCRSTCRGRGGPCSSGVPAAQSCAAGRGRVRTAAASLAEKRQRQQHHRL
ncbi:unnamed protein product [Prorocentrum cordatum]|uniref:OST-HTH associated domain-containing protein n=1 Tax=Prorocentrum cordatum TaxID=2364126 RepID=A0ABN9XT74_9DINO|nr:unnamed protein product [Polarella glacialis]